MDQGRGNAAVGAMVLMSWLLLLLQYSAVARAAAIYTVGGVQGWTFNAAASPKEMEQNLEAMIPKAFFEGDGGSYFKWLPSEFPLLAQTNVGAGRLLLRPRGFAIPHYSDASKVGYVLQGNNGAAGLIFPNKSEEVVVPLNKGGLIPIPQGASSWWFNNGDSDLELIFLGQTKTAHVPGDINYFILTGPLGLLKGFSPEYIARTYDLTQQETDAFLKSQTAGLIFKVDGEKTLPKPQKYSKFVYNIGQASPDAGGKGGGSVTTVAESRFPAIGKSGLTAVLEKLNPNAVRAPVYGADPSIRLIYVAAGSGKIQIVGRSSKAELEVKAGQLVLVPSYFVVGMVAGDGGMECFSIITTTSPLVEELAGKTSVLEALSPAILQVSLNVTAEFEKLLRAKITKTPSLVPPKDRT